MSHNSESKAKKSLIASAIEQLIESPSCNLDAIANGAGVSRRTLHRYFKSRDQMIKECAESIVTEILSDVRKALKMDITPIEQLRVMFEDDVDKGMHFEFCQKFSDHFIDKHIQKEFDEMGRLFNDLLDQLKSDGAIDSSLSNEWLSYVWMGMVRSVNQALKDGAIAPKKANDLAWSAFSSGVIKHT